MAASQQIFDTLFYDEKTSPSQQKINYDGTQYLVDGEILTWQGKVETVYSPIYHKGANQKIEIGKMAFLSEEEALRALNSAKAAFNKGRGKWPMTSAKERIACVEKFAKGLMACKQEIVQILQWEICKTTADAEKEVDRTIVYINDTIKELKQLENKSGPFVAEQGVVAQVRRTPLGVALCVGPFNYPFNETYTTLIPAIIMGNTCVLKTPRTGILCHLPTLKLFKECFPPGVVNIIHGGGRELLPPMLKTGSIDVLAFIGTSKAASDLVRQHPHAQRLRAVLGLDAKNAALILPDADLKVTVQECLLGTLSYNGQRCTALKLLFVHESIAQQFVDEFCKGVEALKMGLPWEKDVAITPVAEPNKPQYLKEVIEDCIKKGGNIVNKGRGGSIDRSFVAPTVLYPVNPTMKVYQEEQFGPVIPIVPYSNLEQVYDFIVNSPYGQQASIFTTGKNQEELSHILDIFSNQVSRINVNSQCQRGPDSLPFTGRKNSAQNTLSVFDALRVMSIRTVVATKQNEKNVEMMMEIAHSRKSNFLRYDHIM